MLPNHKLAPGLVLAASLVAAQKEVPDPSDLRRRGLGGIAVLGGYLYLEGGEVSQYIDGEDDPFGGSRTVNVTLSVSLKESWNNETITFTEIDRPGKPLVKDNNLWADTDGNRLYQWDGQGPFGSNDGSQSPKMWSFEPNGRGRGEWSVKQPANPSTYNSLLRGGGAASTTCDGKVYSIGGFGTSISDEQFDSGTTSMPIPGMVTVDLETQSWSNRSIADMTPPFGALSRSKATCVSGFGDGSSYVMTIGGKSSGPESTESGEAVSMRNITFWDTKNEKWLWQETNGEPPKGRWDHCMAGQASVNGTYEILVYGGRNNVEDVLDDVWVLTLPGFHWQQIDITSPSRYFPACESIGNAQILSLGGYSSGGWATDDPWINGIGIFNLTALAWANGYDAEADEYEPAEAVRDWYIDGGMDHIAWSNDEVKGIFGPEPPFSQSTGDGNGSNGNGNGNNSENEESSSTNVGAIAGGVVGGVAALALIGTAIFFWRRRRANKKESSAELAGNNIHPEYQSVAGADYPPSQGPSPNQMAQGYYAPQGQPQQYQQYYEYKPGAQQYSAELPANQNSLASELDGASSRPSELHGGPIQQPTHQR